MNAFGEPAPEWAEQVYEEHSGPNSNGNDLQGVLDRWGAKTPEELAAGIAERKAAEKLKVMHQSLDGFLEQKNREDAHTGAWAPTDLGPILSGDFKMPKPTILHRTDLEPLLYPGKVHALNAEPESGKTWIALQAAKEVIEGGGNVLYLDFETDAVELVVRLRSLGVSNAAIREHFAYIKPEGRLASRSGDLDTPDAEEFRALVASGEYMLAIIDGVTEAMSVEGLSLSKNDEVARWIKLPRLLRDAGPAVLLLDHVVKASGEQGRWAIGAQHKLAGIDVAFGLQVRKPFGMGRDGKATLSVSKDRAGRLRRRTRNGVLSEVLFTSKGDGALSVELHPPPKSAADGLTRPTMLMERVSRQLDGQLHPVTKRELLGSVTGNAAMKSRAVDVLVQEGFAAVVEQGGKNLHKSIALYTESGDPLVPEQGEGS